MLAFNKIVESRPGAGTFILNVPFDNGTSSIPQGELLDDPLLQSIEMRMIVEPKIIRLAAAKITNERLEEFDTILKEMYQRVTSNEYGAYSLLDLRFHYLCAKASLNPELYSMLKKYCGSPQHVASFGQTLNSEIQTYYQHEEIVEALRNRDPDRAEACMCRHIYLAFNKCATDRNRALYFDRLQLLSAYPLE